MNEAVAPRPSGDDNPILEKLIETCGEAAAAAEALAEAARAAVGARVTASGKLDAAALEAEQFAAHGFAWLRTYVEGLKAMLGWARRLDDEGRFGELEQLIFATGVVVIVVGVARLAAGLGRALPGGELLDLFLELLPR